MKSEQVLGQIQATTRGPLNGGPRPMYIGLSAWGREVLAIAAGWKGALDDRELQTLYGIPIRVREPHAAAPPEVWAVYGEDDQPIASGMITRP